MAGITAEKEYEVNYYEVDYKKRILLTSIMNYFGDICTMQSENLGINLDYMKENNMAWVLFKWDINIIRYPLYGENVKVKTVPYSFRKFYAYRKFEVMDSSGKVVITANSLWFLIDTLKRKSLKIPEEMYKAFGIESNNNEKLEIKKVQIPQEFDVNKDFNVRYSDIDTNLHVNNVKYAAWAIETVPMEVVLNYTLNKINITYEKETVYGEVVTVSTKVNNQDNEIICVHKITDSTENIITLAETTWVQSIPE